jgi:hypothetical protein
MSLSGTLEVFPLEEVLRLVARSHTDGCLRVVNDQEGRIYIENGSLSYATVEPDETLRARLIASGLATEESLSRLDVSRSALTEALSPAVAPSALTELVREQSIEALYRIRKPGTGNFEFLVDTHPRYASGQSFDIEAIITEAERRASEWADIESVVPDLTVPWRMVPSLEEESVNLSDTAWRFLAAMDGSCAVDALADRLGITRFQTARRMAELGRARLVETVPAPQPAAGGEGFSSWVSEPHEPVQEETPAEAVSEPVAEPVTEEAPTSWWQDSPQTPDQPAEEAPVGQESPVAEETIESEAGAEPDESFLETVFGELEKSEDDEDPEASDTEGDDDSGFGLLRRRGLGAAFRELADS